MKYCIGPMTKNIVDTIIKYVDDTGNVIGFIPSRRQVEFNGGYVNNWNTYDFCKYVRNKTNKIPIIRDHGGPKQGNIDDDGLTSFSVDSVCLDGIHIDIWKYEKDLFKAVDETVKHINYCLSINSNLFFEVGTEESIRKYSANELHDFLYMLRVKLDKSFSKIKYAVIQSGTSLKTTVNTGKYDKNRLKDMIEICNRFNLLSKEHNGDYISQEEKKEKFDLGLSCINIAPEFGVIETQVIMDNINDEEMDKFFNICYESKKWVKWVPENFDPISNKKELIRICGHYVRNNTDICNIVDRKELNGKIKETIYNKLTELFS
jgi:hypothetical protein